MTTFIRTHLLNAYTALPLFICLLVSGWSTHAASMATKAKPHLSGEAMFRGLFFLEGAYTDLIPELHALRTKPNHKPGKPADQIKTQTIQNQIVTKIQAQDPHFFTQFQTALESGNYISVQNALKTGQSMAENAVKQISQEMNQGHYKVRSDAGTCVVLVYYCSTVFTLLMPMCPTMGIVIAEEMAQNRSSLLREQLVASICQLSAYSS